MNTMTGDHSPAPKHAAKSIARVLQVTALLLLVPLVAMQFTDQVKWNHADFAVAALLLAGTGLLYELVIKRGRNGLARALGGIVLAAVLVYVWLELAVGIIGIAGISGT